MNKRTCMLVGFHALALAGITAGYAYLINENKKQPKLTVKSINNPK